jgi:hypothetical protein
VILFKRLIMSTVSRLAYFSLFSALSAMATTNGFAADQNTYRSGSPYLKTNASHYQQCANQCRGDASCRGWNFIRPNPQSRSGICEFNAQSAQPMRSPISISGENRSDVDVLMSRAVPRGARTIRVGYQNARPVTARPRVQKQPQSAQKSKTRVVRQPVPAQKANGQTNTQPTSHTQSTKVEQSFAEKIKPRIYGGPALQKQPELVTRAPIASQPTPQGLSPQQRFYREQYLALKRRQQQAPAQPQYRDPQQQILAARPGAPRALPTPAQQAAIRQRIPQQAPLYGSLHDDLSANMTAVPRPATAPDNLANPDAAIATSRAVKTIPVRTDRLIPVRNPGLAGSNGQ